jgi:ribulose-bisphosphate carboxylase large chain
MEQVPAPEIISNSRFSIVYRISVFGKQQIERIAQDICIEQTVEFPAECIPPEILEKGIVGTVENISPAPAD